MTKEQPQQVKGLNQQYQRYDRQKCFVGHSIDANWRDDLVDTCNHVLPEFDLEPWYAADHFDPTRPLREKVVELIANARYGIYDLSYWRKDDKGEWIMPRNVFIELGIAIALNRPILLLRHAENRASDAPFSSCLESVSAHIPEFSGRKTLMNVLRESLAQWTTTRPEEDWWNRYCSFGNRVCEYREVHPYRQQWGQEILHCHISDGQDTDRPDFRGIVDEVLSRFDNVTFDYLDALPLPEGYDFLLCTYCQAVRSTPFAIYRIASQTPAETFIAIGMSLALETQFGHKIPKILLTANTHDIPSLLAGYEVVVARNDQERMASLRKFVPMVIRQARQTIWKPRPLPFIEIVPRHPDKPREEEPLHEREAPQNAQGDTSPDNVVQDSAPEEIEEAYIGEMGKYGLIRQIARGSNAEIFLARDLESKQMYALKALYLDLTKDSELLARFQREAQILMNLNDSHIVRIVDYTMDSTRPFIVTDYIDGQNLKYHILKDGPMEAARALDYTRQIAEGLDTAYKHGVVHRDIKPQNIMINTKDVVKITDFGLARSRESVTLTQSNVFMGTAYYISPEQAESGRFADTRSDLYALATNLFEMLTGQPPYQGETAVDIVIKHMNERVPDIRRLRPGLPHTVNTFMQKALAKSPIDRFATPREFIVALEQLQQDIQSIPLGSPVAQSEPDPTRAMPPTKGTRTGITYPTYPFGADRQPAVSPPAYPFENPAVSPAYSFENDEINALIGRSLGQFRIVERIGAGGMATVFKAYQPGLDRYVAVKVLPAYYARDPIFVKRFVQEARSVAKLQHANIVPIHEFGEQDYITYIVMEYVDGGTLKDRVKWPLSVTEAVNYIRQAAEGLDCAHYYGIVHRDVKPGNMLLRKNGHLLLSDFGIAKILEGTTNLTRAGTGIGTPQYMSPEQGTGQAVNIRSDIYSLGITFFHCLAGRVPFTADSPISITVKHLNEPLPVAPLRAVGVPFTLEQIIVKMTAKAPAQRYQSMQEVIEALRSISPAVPSAQPGPLVYTNPAPLQQLHKEGNWSPSRNAPNEMYHTPINVEPPVPAVPDWTPAGTYDAPYGYAGSTQDAYIGTRIGMYRMVRFIGSGGLGRVYLAQHEILTGRTAAIKLLHSRTTSAQQQSGFFEEALLLDKLKHPYILPIIDVGLHNGLPYIITEYVPNGSLRDRIRPSSIRPVTIREVVNILSQVGQALDYTHRQNIIHRDIKPENILFNGRNEALLADFSIAITVLGDYQAVNVVGTPRYMAPEQFRGVISKRSDQYALGCVAYELFTGQQVFSNNDFSVLDYQHTKERPIPPRQLNSALSSRIERALLKALAKDPAERYPDITTFIKALS